jgi:hypothetical protein
MRTALTTTGFNTATALDYGAARAAAERFATRNGDDFDVVRLTDGDRVSPDRSWEAYSERSATGGREALRVTIDGPRVAVAGPFTATRAASEPANRQVNGVIALTCPRSQA